MKTSAVIYIQISDPWDLGESLKWQKIDGVLFEIVNTEYGGQGLIKLNNIINYCNIDFQNVIAQPRHLGDNFLSILNGEKIFCSFTVITDEQANSKVPFDLSTWRGGITFIGDIQIKYMSIDIGEHDIEDEEKN